MTLTQDDLQTLRAPFPSSEVKQIDKGYGALDYIDEEPISNRIEDVDPSWSLGEPITIEDTPSSVTIKISLTIKGVTRWGVGTEKKNSGNEPFKSAATDAFKRAARLFGIGRYLLNGSGSSGSSSSTPSNSRNSSNLSESPPVPDGSEHYSEEVRTVKTIMTKKGTPMYIIADASMFESTPLETIGIDTSSIKTAGEHQLSAPVIVKWKQSGKYKNVIAVKNNKTGDVAQLAS